MGKRVPHPLLTVLNAADRSDPPCPHANEGCGGCMLQEYPYEEQARAKEAILTESYGRTVRVTPCTTPLGYRSRMDFVTTRGAMGLRRRGKFNSVVDIHDCLLLPDHARTAYRQARTRLRDAGIPDYDVLRHEGFLRYLTVRASSATGQVLLILTTTSPKDETTRATLAALLEEVMRETGAVGVVWTVNDSKSDISVGTPYWRAGREWLEDEIAGIRFLVGPETFFQGNPGLAGDLFVRAASFARGNVLDLCCGVGVLGMLAERSDSVTRVIGVDIVPQSVRAASENAMRNGIPTNRCSFVCADAAVFLATSGERFDTVLCDPARPGLGKEVCKLLIDAAPERIVYVSCNPETHREDLKLLAEKYDVTLLEAFDLFPQTPHVEVLSVLERKSDVATFD